MDDLFAGGAVETHGVRRPLGLDMGDPSSLETLTRTHILIMALDAVLDELPPDADVKGLIG